MQAQPTTSKKPPLILILIFVAGIAVLLIVAWPNSPSASAPPRVQPTVAAPPTIAVQPTQAALADLLLQPKDFAQSVKSGALVHEPPAFFDKLEVPAADQTLVEDLDTGKNMGQVSFVSVLRYENSAPRTEAYIRLTSDLRNDNSHLERSVGEKSLVSSLESAVAKISLHTIVFQRCSAIAYVRITDPAISEDQMVVYAQQLDQRITSIVCK